MLIGICSDKGSPGATTTALALASTLPDPAVVVEVDPLGADLAIRLRTHSGAALPKAPTVLTVATAARSNRSADLFAKYAHPFTSGVSVVPGPVVAEQASGVADWQPLADLMAVCASPLFVDFGILHGGSRLLPMAAQAEVLVVVGRPDPGSVIRLRERLTRLSSELASDRGKPPRLLPVLVCSNRHGPGHVADLGRILAETPAKPFLVGAGFVAYDPASVRRLQRGEEPNGRLARTPLMRSGSAINKLLSHILDDNEQVPAATVKAEGGR
ncbi:MAG: hypothetical protein ACRDPG_05375 [Nocardioidaceae bacterium]